MNLPISSNSKRSQREYCWLKTFICGAVLMKKKRKIKLSKLDKINSNYD